jgi:hypothetical protein
MDKIEYRAVIKLFVKEDLTSDEINSKFIKVYGDSSPSFSTIKKWAAEFKRGRTSLRKGSNKRYRLKKIYSEISEVFSCCHRAGPSF